MLRDTTRFKKKKILHKLHKCKTLVQLYASRVAVLLLSAFQAVVGHHDFTRCGCRLLPLSQE